MTTLSLKYSEDDRIIRLTIDSQGPVNTIDAEMTASLEKILEEVEGLDAGGIVIDSAKKGSFITGADLEELFGEGPKGIEESLAGLGGVLDKLSKVRVPVVAVLDEQAAVGGGFELLLRCCDHVFATRRSSFGFPEANLGLVPAVGGIYILPRITGLEAALNLVFRGRTVKTEQLAATGMATLCGSGELMDKALMWLKGHGAKSDRVANPAGMKIEPEDASEREKILGRYRKRAEVSPHRPWLNAAVRLFEAALDKGYEEFIGKNAEEFQEISGHQNSKNKVDFYFLKTFKFPRLITIDKDSAVNCDRIGIIGSGLMGSGIAQVSADRGIKVTLMDVSEEVVQGSIEKLRKALGGLVKKGRWTEKRMNACMDNLSIATSLEAFRDFPLVIEAVPENLELKKKFVGDIHKLNENIIFASNTSSLPIGDIAQGTSRPDQVVGMHFFSPVPLMELLEVIEGKETSKSSTATALLLGKRMGKTNILVGDGPGFYTSRTFSSGLLYGGFYAVEAGADPWHVDKIGVRAGFPRGPLHMFCSVGGIIPYHAGQFMEKRLAPRMPVPACLAAAAEAGYVGAGGEKGFYKDEAGRIPDESVLDVLVRKKGLPVPDDDEIADILLLGMVNEAFHILGEGILRDYASMDIGGVLGIGFPDCFHGPARYASTRGLPDVVRRVEELGQKFSIPQFVVAPELKKLAAMGGTGSLI